MINHSPAQLIAEIERLMDMDYERLPGARHVLEEAIAVIRPLAEKSAVGEMIDPLRALVAQCGWKFPLRWDGEDVLAADDRVLVWEGEVGEHTARRFVAIMNALDALLSAPVGSPPPLQEKDQESASRGGSVPGTPQGDLPRRATGDA